MIAIDVMGGDFAPQQQLMGAYRAVRNLAIPVTLFGPQSVMQEGLDAIDPQWTRYPITLRDAVEVVGMDEHPVHAVRTKTNSSLVQAVMSVKRGDCSAVVSAGNSGALMAAATFILGRENGVERPAIGGFLPTKKGEVLCLDLGANTDCRAIHLLQFAHLGVEHIQHVKGLERPRVGLLANGAESSKGSRLVQEAYPLLERSGLNFVGNIEPEALFDHAVDVLVCDGFVGNILLKTIEACTNLNSWHDEEVGQVAPSSHARQGGALLLGVQGTVIVAHGAANAAAMQHAIMKAYDACAHSVCESSAPAAAPIKMASSY